LNIHIFALQPFLHSFFLKLRGIFQKMTKTLIFYDNGQKVPVSLKQLMALFFINEKFNR